MPADVASAWTYLGSLHSFYDSSTFLSAEDERALIAKAQAGDTHAEAQILTAFAPLIRSEVRKFTRGNSLASGIDIKDIEHEVRACVLAAIRRFDPNNGARLGTLAKTIIDRRLPRQVYQQPPRGDALSHVDAGEWDPSTVVVSATQPRPLTPVQWAKLTEISNMLRLTRKAALISDQEAVVRARYDYGDTTIEAARRLRVSRTTIDKREDAALKALRGTLTGAGYTRGDARADLAALSRDHARRTAPMAPKASALEKE